MDMYQRQTYLATVTLASPEIILPLSVAFLVSSIWLRLLSLDYKVLLLLIGRMRTTGSGERGCEDLWEEWKIGESGKRAIAGEKGWPNSEEWG